MAKPCTDAIDALDEAIRQAAFAAAFKACRAAMVDTLAAAHEGALSALEANGHVETGEMGEAVGRALGVAAKRAIEDATDGTATEPVLPDVRTAVRHHVECAVAGVLSGGKLLGDRLAASEAHGASPVAEEPGK